MKIAIDARVLETSASNRGVGYYAQSLIKYLMCIKSSNDFLFISTFFARSKKLDQLDIAQFYKIPTMYRPRRFVRYFDKFFAIVWNRFLINSDPDILHITHLFELYYLNIPTKIKTVVTIFDLMPLIYKHIYLKNKKQLNWYVNRLNQVKNANMVITISESSKKDLIELINIPKEKIKVIYCGVNQRFKLLDKTKSREIIRKKYGVSNKFILSIGSTTFNKNAPGIFKSFKNYLSVSKDKEVFLVVVCALESWEQKIWEEDIKQLGISKNVILTNFIPDSDLPLFYNAAELLLFPSFYEGFGLPIAEAMACGCPVITSNVSSMPEVGGRAAHYVNPKSIKSIASGINTVLTDDKLRKRMIKSGLNQAKKFNWKLSAQETIKIYNSILKKL